jgi:hypothetical protein
MRIPVPGGPEIELLSVDEAGDEAQLRRVTRVWSAGRRGPHVSHSYAYPFALVGSHRHRIGVHLVRVREELLPARARSRVAGPAPASAPAGPRHEVSIESSRQALAQAMGPAGVPDAARLPSPAAGGGATAEGWRAAELDLGPDLCAWVCWQSAGQGEDRELAEPVLGDEQRL